MRRTLLPLIACSLFAVACGGGAASGPADTSVRPGGTGWFCHGEENAAFCARSTEECESLRTSTQSGSEPQAEGTASACTARAQAHCFTFQHPTVGTHHRCYDSAQHCESSRGRCTSDETCSTCDVWD